MENIFRARKTLRGYYWLGLEKSGNLYYWQDGTKVNNGATSNADPCEPLPLHLPRPCYHTTGTAAELLLHGLCATARASMPICNS